LRDSPEGAVVEEEEREGLQALVGGDHMSSEGLTDLYECAIIELGMTSEVRSTAP
jgi:hypothetical protein